jgi:hypothetical protein
MRSTRLLVCASFVLAAWAPGCGGLEPTAPATPASPPAVSRIAPTSAALGDNVTISGTGFTETGNAIKLGSGYLLNVSSADSTSLQFALPGFLGVCPPGQAVCIQLALAVTPGDYKVSVINSHGTSNEVVLHVVAE